MDFFTSNNIDDPADGPTSVFGILYAEDFDDPVDMAANSAEESEVPKQPPPPLTQADLDAACEEAVRVARLEWQAGTERASRDAVSALNPTLGNLREIAERATLAAAEGTITTILTMVSGLLPHFCLEHGPAEVRSLLARLLPTIRSQERITVRVHPDLVALVQRDLAGLDTASASMIEVTAAPLQPGDVKVSWENGSLVRDTQQIAQAIEDALNELGLKRAVEAPAKRRMAYAD